MTGGLSITILLWVDRTQQWEPKAEGTGGRRKEFRTLRPLELIQYKPLLQMEKLRRREIK